MLDQYFGIDMMTPTLRALDTHWIRSQPPPPVVWFNNAQFCAFAQYPDGRRLPTSTSAAVPYCRQLFEEWSRERIS
jgi:hypothetical protein